MAEYLVQDTTLIALADAIRAKTGSNNNMSLADMIVSVGQISGGGDFSVSSSAGKHIANDNALSAVDMTIFAVTTSAFCEIIE